MKTQLSPEFEEDPYIESLVKQRESDPITYSTYPEAVREVVEQYEREKASLSNDKTKHR